MRPIIYCYKIYKLCITSIRIILNEGWYIFFKKAYLRFICKSIPTKGLYYELLKFNFFISKTRANNLVFPTISKKTDVSIVIPVYNNWEYTLNCLKSISENTSGDYEVVVIDDASNDKTAKILSRVKGLNLLRNKQNAGFIESCNRGVRASKSKYIFFLNNDTLVAKNWLPPLLELIKKKDVGAVGCKLIYPDGRLQEAGSMVWRDGSAYNYGRGDNPDKPEYNYVREVDYCSGAALLVKRELFKKIGSFDERFKPGYYEDTDLCFSIRNLGYKVMYQPMSTIVHFEGLTCGTDIHTGIKKYQEINKPKFTEKWKNSLRNYCYSPSQNNIFLAREKYSGQRILVVDHFIPLYDKYSGSLRMFNVLQLLKELGHKITFVGYDSTERVQPYARRLQQEGIEIAYAPYVSSVKEYLEMFGRYFNVVILSRGYVAISVLGLVKENCPAAKIIFDTVDLAFLREFRRAEIENDKEISKRAEVLKKRELYLAQNSDVTFVVSPLEKEILLKEDSSLTVEVVSNIYCVKPLEKPFSQRKDILFIGSFGWSPNIDAVTFFVKEIFPRVKQKIRDGHFFIVGADPPKEILSLRNKNVIIAGHVRNLLPYFKNCKLSVAPLRYGAGVKGKINQSMSYGVPVVTTTIGAEGMGLIDGENALISDDPDDFADKVISLYKNENLWSRLSRNSMKNVKKNFSHKVAREKLVNVFYKINYQNRRKFFSKTSST